MYILSENNVQIAKKFLHINKIRIYMNIIQKWNPPQNGVIDLLYIN